MQLRLPVRWDTRLHRHPDQFMPEPHAAAIGQQDPVRQALIDRRILASGGQQRHVHPRAHDRRGLHRAPRAWAQPGQPGRDHVTDRGGHRWPSGRHDLADVEGVAAGDPVKFGGVHVPLTRQLPHGVLRQGRQPQPPRRALRGHVAQHDAERVIVGHLIVTAGGQQQAPGAAEPPPGEGEQIQRCFIRPVHILDHRHRDLRGGADLGYEGGEQLVAGGLRRGTARPVRRPSARRCRTGARAGGGSAARRRRPTASGCRRCGARTPPGARSCPCLTRPTPGPAGHGRFWPQRHIHPACAGKTHAPAVASPVHHLAPALSPVQVGSSKARLAAAARSAADPLPGRCRQHAHGQQSRRQSRPPSRTTRVSAKHEFLTAFSVGPRQTHGDRDRRAVNRALPVRRTLCRGPADDQVPGSR